jgi:hypothetical protein
MWGLSIEIIRRMTFMYPKALKIFNKHREAPLHMASRSIRPSLDVIQLIASECQALCLLNNIEGRTPYHEAVSYGGSAAILDFLLCYLA